MRALAFASLLLAFLLAFAPARADEIACKETDHSSSSTGVVLLHGGLSNYFVQPLERRLKRAGFRVVMPEMPWSERREYDQPYMEALQEVDRAAKGLREQGARRIVIVGHSFGANAALGYGAYYDHVAGIVVMAPGQMPELPSFQKFVGPSVAQARAMVAAGHGNEHGVFKDFLQWRHVNENHATAANYLSYFAPDAKDIFPKNAAMLKPGTPLLWFVGRQEEDNMALGKAYAYDKAPPTPLNRYIVLPKGHLDVPVEAEDMIVEWLKCL